MAELALSNVISISVAAAPAGVGSYNTSNLALFTRDVPGGGFGGGTYKIYKSASEVVTDFGSGSNTAKMAQAAFAQKPNILTGGGYLVVIPMLTVPGAENLEDAITRMKDVVQFFGILVAEISVEARVIAATTLVQTLNKMIFIPSKTAADVEPAGMLDDLRTATKTHARGLLYVGTGLDIDALNFSAAYASRLLSTDFSGSNTTQTIHLKDLATISPDSGMTQTILGKCVTAGVDVYASLQGVSKVFNSGANSFADQVYNQLWFIGALEVAGFNALAQSSSKLPQTEQGVSLLKAAYRTVCEQAVRNQYSAPGTWTSVDSFGTPEDFHRNIESRGYYIYSSPVATQLAADRAARKSPLIQIALKEAGAVHSSSVIVNINA